MAPTTQTAITPRRALVLGVGNLLWADEGFGVRCVEAFAERFAVGPEVELCDGGTQGLYLVDYFQRFDPIVIFDAIDFGDEPGTLRLVHDEAIPAFVAANKMSLHQAGLNDVIACARLLGGAAQHQLLIGVQPVELEDYGGSLRPAVRNRVPEALDHAAAYLRAFGIVIDRRRDRAPGAPVMPASLSLERYERERPDGAIACRHGDARILAQVEAG